MKNKRQQKILELIDAFDIDTQEMMIDLLRKEGINATQTTISRDIRELKLVKGMTGKGEYKYILPGIKRENNVPVMNEALADSVLRVEAAGNIVVVQTYPGMANALADYIGVLLSEMGFKGAVVEGAKHVLGWRSPNYVYSNPIARNFKLLFRNQDLSDDIAIRFSNTFWTGYPLTAEKFLDWIMRDPNHRTITIAMDYRVLGDYMDTSSGIFHFFTNIPRTVFQYTDFQFLTPDEIFNKMDSVAAVYIPNETSWQAAERDTSFWLGNDLQRDFFNKLYALEEAVKYSSDKALLNDWRRLQDADYLGDMNLRWLTEQNISNKKFSPYNAYINLVNIYNDLEMRIQQLKFSRMVVRKKMRNEKSEELVFEP